MVDNCEGSLCRQLLAFEPGAKIKVDKFYYSYGGGAANAAVCLTNFGFKTACLAPIGDDENGRFIIDNLRGKGIGVELLKKVNKEESGSSFVLVAPSGERIIFAQRGANTKLKVGRSDLAVLKRTQHIYIASLAGVWKENLRKIFSAVGHNHHWIFWNPGMTQYLGGIAPISSFLKKVTVLSSNHEEAVKLIASSKEHKNLTKKSLRNIELVAKLIHQTGPQIVVITMGSAGVIAYDGHKFYRYAALKDRKRVDTTGIGDAFNSSFAAGLVLFKGDIDRALRLGLKNTAAKVRHLGAQNGLLTLKDIKNL